MNKLAAVALALLPAAVTAAPFDGTWVIDPSSAAWVHAVPSTYLLQDGRFTCGANACNPPFTVPSDGKPHRVEGHPSYNNVAVTIVSARTVRVSARKDGAKDWEDTLTVAQDGNELTDQYAVYEGGKVARTRETYSRSAAGLKGAHAVSGSWLANLQSFAPSPEMATITYRESADGLQMSDPLGESYDAKFDGKEYLTKRDPTRTLVSIERLGPRAIRETDRVSGRIRGVATMEATKDGMAIQVLYEDKLTGAALRYVLKRTPPLASEPFEGTWKLLVDRSKLSSHADLESATLTISRVGPNSFRTVQSVVSRRGECLEIEQYRTYDGTEHPAAGRRLDTAGRSVIATRVDPYTRKIIDKRDGKITSETTAVVARDLKSMRGVIRLPDGTEQIQIYQRQGS